MGPAPLHLICDGKADQIETVASHCQTSLLGWAKDMAIHGMARSVKITIKRPVARKSGYRSVTAAISIAKIEPWQTCRTAE